jgi:hypothetical protein
VQIGNLTQEDKQKGMKQTDLWKYLGCQASNLELRLLFVCSTNWFARMIWL